VKDEEVPDWEGMKDILQAVRRPCGRENENSEEEET